MKPLKKTTKRLAFRPLLALFLLFLVALAIFAGGSNIIAGQFNRPFSATGPDFSTALPAIGGLILILAALFVLALYILIRWMG